MHEMTVYAKSAKGREEIATRAHKLAFKHRALLIMVDGASSVAMLLTKAGTVGDVPSMLSELRDQGFIEPVASSTAEAAQIAATGPAAAPVAAPIGAPKVTAEQSDMDLPAAKLAAVKFLENTLGPDAVDLAVRLEESKTSEDFLKHAEKCSEVLKRVSGAKSADAFWRQIEEHAAATA
ncbi:MAG: hypothetical protein ACREV9_12690 [Burkholderiales bacterium]